GVCAFKRFWHSNVRQCSRQTPINQHLQRDCAQFKYVPFGSNYWYSRLQLCQPRTWRMAQLHNRRFAVWFSYEWRDGWSWRQLQSYSRQRSRISWHVHRCHLVTDSRIRAGTLGVLLDWGPGWHALGAGPSRRTSEGGNVTAYKLAFAEKHDAGGWDNHNA